VLFRSIQGRAHAAYATFASVTEPLVQRQDELPATLLSALVAVEQAASAAGLGASLGGMLGEGMGGIVVFAHRPQDKSGPGELQQRPDGGDDQDRAAADFVGKCSSEESPDGAT
jgi:hypothetical protein